MKKTREMPVSGHLIRTPIDSIEGPHPRLQSLLERLDLPPSPGWGNEILTEQALLAMLELHPPHVMKMRDGLRYLSGLPLLTEMKRLERDIDIPVLLHSRREPAAQILTRALSETLLLQLLYRPRIDRVTDFLDLTNKLADQDECLDILNTFGLDDKNNLARLLQVSPRTVARHGA